MFDRLEQFFALLRYSLLVEETAPQIKDEEWSDIFTLAERHSLLGVVFHGIQKSGLKPPQNVFYQWLSYIEQIRALNMKVNEVVVEVTRLFEQNGFRSCILKGQGNALSYPDPYSRTPGDIDIWVKPEGNGKSKKEDVRQAVTSFVQRKWPGQVERYHHVEMPPIKGVPIEVHFIPAYMRNLIYNRRLQKWFAEQADEQFSHQVILPDSEAAISIPKASFNSIYQLQHMYSHLFTEGFGLRQVTDYYFVLKKFRDESLEFRDSLKSIELEETLKYLGLWKFARAMMWVMQRVYSLDSKYFIAEPDQKEGEFVLNEILQSGNMGHYDTRLGHKEGETVAHRYFRMTLRNMRFVKHYPSEALCEPIFRTWYFFWQLTHR